MMLKKALTLLKNC